MVSVLKCSFSGIVACVSVVRGLNVSVPVFSSSNDVGCVCERVDIWVMGRVVRKALFSDDTDVGVMVCFNWGTELLAFMLGPGVTEENLFIFEVWEVCAVFEFC